MQVPKIHFHEKIYCKRNCMQVHYNVNTVTLLNIFRLALNCGWSQTERNQIIDETWLIIQHKIRALFQDFLINGIIFNYKSAFCLLFPLFIILSLILMFKLLFMMTLMIFLFIFGRKRRSDAVVPRHFKRNIDPSFVLNSMFHVLTF